MSAQALVNYGEQLIENKKAGESRLLNLVCNSFDSYQPRAQRVMRAKLFSENMLPYKRVKKSSSHLSTDLFQKQRDSEGSKSNIFEYEDPA